MVHVDFLHTNADIFAWSPSDMPGIPREVAEHSLDILLLTVNSCIKVRLDLQAHKSPIVVKGPFFP
jgi:hypothetical protein